MSDSPTRPVVRPRAALLAALVATLAVPAAPAEAQFGKILRGAAGQVVGKKAEAEVEKRTGAPAETGPVELLPPKFDAQWVEITPARLDGYLKARAAVAAESPDRLRQIRELGAQAEARDAEARAIDYAREQQAHDARMATWDACAEPVRQELAGANGPAAQAAMATMTSPEAIALQQKIAAAQKRGDQAEVNRLSMQMSERMRKATDAAEEAALTKRCGARPPLPPALRRWEALNTESARLRARADTVAMSLQAGPRAGLTASQEGMMLERMGAFLRRSRYPISRTFTQGEWDLLTARRAEVERLLAAS